MIVGSKNTSKKLFKQSNIFVNNYNNLDINYINNNSLASCNNYNNLTNCDKTINKLNSAKLFNKISLYDKSISLSNNLIDTYKLNTNNNTIDFKTLFSYYNYRNIIKDNKYNTKCVKQNNFEISKSDSFNINKQADVSCSKYNNLDKLLSKFKYLNLNNNKIINNNNNNFNSQEYILSTLPDKYLKEESNSTNIFNINYNNSQQTINNQKTQELKLVTIFKYHLVATLNKGSTFGEVALLSDFKKRSATCICSEDTELGTISTLVYNNCLKKANVESYKSSICALTKNVLLNSFPINKFKKYVFYKMENKKLNKGTLLIKSNVNLKYNENLNIFNSLLGLDINNLNNHEKCYKFISDILSYKKNSYLNLINDKENKNINSNQSKVYFVKSGEFSVSITCTLFELKNLIDYFKCLNMLITDCKNKQISNNSNKINNNEDNSNNNVYCNIYKNIHYSIFYNEIYSKENNKFINILYNVLDTNKKYNNFKEVSNFKYLYKKSKTLCENISHNKKYTDFIYNKKFKFYIKSFKNEGVIGLIDQCKVVFNSKCLLDKNTLEMFAKYNLDFFDSINMNNYDNYYVNKKFELNIYNIQNFFNFYELKPIFDIECISESAEVYSYNKLAFIKLLELEPNYWENYISYYSLKLNSNIKRLQCIYNRYMKNISNNNFFEDSFSVIPSKDVINSNIYSKEKNINNINYNKSTKISCISFSKNKISNFINYNNNSKYNKFSNLNNIYNTKLSSFNIKQENNDNSNTYDTKNYKKYLLDNLKSKYSISKYLINNSNYNVKSKHCINSTSIIDYKPKILTTDFKSRNTNNKLNGLNHIKYNNFKLKTLNNYSNNKIKTIFDISNFEKLKLYKTFDRTNLISYKYDKQNNKLILKDNKLLVNDINNNKNSKVKHPKIKLNLKKIDSSINLATHYTNNNLYSVDSKENINYNNLINKKQFNIVNYSIMHQLCLSKNLIKSKLTNFIYSPSNVKSVKSYIDKYSDQIYSNLIMSCKSKKLLKCKLNNKILKYNFNNNNKLNNISTKCFKQTNLKEFSNIIRKQN